MSGGSMSESDGVCAAHESPGIMLGSVVMYRGVLSG
jgi:hypothetical protein